MPDWNALVRERLGPLNLPSKEAQEIVAELAAHVEDLYEEQIGKGCSAREAQQLALNEVVRWRHLAQQIQRTKQREETMNTRTKHLWLPGLVSLSAAMGSLMILILISLQPRFLGRSPLQMVLLPWLILLPFCGGAGAYLSRRGGGNSSARLVAGLFPTIVLGVLGAVLVLSHLVVFAQPRWWYGLLALALGVIMPSVALLLGAMPFFKTANPKELA